MGKNARATILSLSAWLLAAAVSLKLGAVPGMDPDVVAQLRFPRILLAAAVGMGLSVAGAALQAIFSNPLCEPYTLGISAGSALGAVIGASLGGELGFTGLAGWGFAGALAFTAVLLLVSFRPGTRATSLLLVGVMLGFLGSSLIALWMALADSSGIQGALFWIMGDLSRARLRGAALALALSAALCCLIWSRWKLLDALLMGDEWARAIGVPVDQARRYLVLAVSILVGLCVSASGMIGFVGLVVPHLARRWVGAPHYALIPVSALLGAGVVTVADAVARTVAAPYDLPVGVVTAIVGAPAFAAILLRRGDSS